MQVHSLERQHVDLRIDYLAPLEANPKPAYDLVNDPKFKIQWHEGAVRIAHDSSLSYQPSTVEDFPAFMEAVIEAFNHALEDSDLCRLLWNGSTPRSKKDAQTFFLHAVRQYCNANGVRIARSPTRAADRSISSSLATSRPMPSPN